MIPDVETYLGPLGLTAACLVAIFALWCSDRRSFGDLRKDLAACQQDHKEANKIIVKLVEDASVIRGKLEILEMQATQKQTTVSEITKIFTEALLTNAKGSNGQNS